MWRLLPQAPHLQILGAVPVASLAVAGSSRDDADSQADERTSVPLKSPGDERQTEPSYSATPRVGEPGDVDDVSRKLLESGKYRVKFIEWDGILNTRTLLKER